jgi:hypothetical protein
METALGSCGSDSELVDAHPHLLAVAPSTRLSFPTIPPESVSVADRVDPHMIRPMWKMAINGRPYWKMSDNPSDYR